MLYLAGGVQGMTDNSFGSIEGCHPWKALSHRPSGYVLVVPSEIQSHLLPLASFNSESRCFRRCCAKFGLGLYLYVNGRYSLFVDYRVQLESLPSVYGQLSHTPKSLKRL